MVKKLGIVALALVAIAALLSYTKAGSYARTAYDKVRDAAGKQVPVEFEIDRLRSEVAQLIPDMKKHRSAIAEESVAIDNLKEEIGVVRTNLALQKTKLLQMTEDLEGGSSVITYGNRDYTPARLGEMLARDLASFKRTEAELKNKDQLLEVKEKALEAAKEQLASIREQKMELAVQIEKLEAELKTVRLAQTRSQFHFDDSRLSEIKRSLGELRTRLKVEMAEVELEGQFADPVAGQKKAKPVREVTKDVRDYFRGDNKPVVE